MNLRSVKTIIFVVWIVVIAILSIVPHANEGGGLSFKLTDSGMVLHFGAYFIAASLLYWAFIKGPQISQISADCRERETKIILISSFTIFLYSFVLEIVQIYLPYRTFNPVDILGNASGIAFFVLAWLVFWRRRPGMALFWGDD